MPAKQCYYEVLGVPRDADDSDIKKAYRQLAMRFHPDRNPDCSESEERFKEASEAYAILSDQQQRQVYDRFGHDGLSGGAQPFSGGGFEDIFSNFGDILGDLFGGRGGGRGRSRGPRRGANLRLDIEIDFEDVVTGVRRDVTFDRHDVCGTCKGNGAKAGTQPEACHACSGSGRIARQQGFFMVQTTCPVCRGGGQIVKDRCGDCSGEGVRVVQRTLSVKVPAGIDEGMRLRVAGEGETGGPDTQRGDLTICVHVKPHEVFQRDGAHIHLAQDIAYTEAALGADLTVTTVHGDESVTIPPGTQPGTVIRLRNRGLPRVDGVGRGDQFVTLNVAVPDDLSKQQAALLEQLRAVGL